MICYAISEGRKTEYSNKFYDVLEFIGNLISDTSDSSPVFINIIRFLQHTYFFIGVLIFLIIAIFQPVNHSFNIHDLKTNAEKVEFYMSNKNPTRNFCIEAEYYNEYTVESLKKYKYITEEVANSLQKVDTEILWNRFCSNVEAAKARDIYR